MARTVRDSKLETRAARDRLKAGPDIHWKSVTPGKLHLGYRRRRKNEPGVWIVRTYLGVDAGGKGRYSKRTLGTADDYQDADGQGVLSYADAQKIALGGTAGSTRSAGALTVADAVADYVAHLAGERPRTAKEVEHRAALHVLPQLGSAKVNDLTVRSLTEWRNALAATPARLRPGRLRPLNVRPSSGTKDELRARKVSANKSVTIVKAALNYAFKHDEGGLVKSDKAWRMLASFAGVDAPRERWLTVEESQRLLNAADKDSGLRDLIHAALLTGMRYGELARLKVRDFAAGKVHVAESKSGKSRDVRLTDEGREFFKQLTTGREADELMLGREWRKSDQARPMRAACKAARIKPAVSIHALRHTWASLAVMSGTPLIVVARNLGHADTRMVEKHYGHLAKWYEDDAIESGAPRFGLVGASNVVPAVTRR